MELSNKIRFHGKNMEDLIIVEKILRYLKPSFNYFVFSFEESNDLVNYSLDNLQILLLIHEHKTNQNLFFKEQVFKTFACSYFINLRGHGRGRGGKGD